MAGGRGARFREPLDPGFAALNASIGFDRRLAAADLRQSRAHVEMLRDRGLIPADDARRLLAGLNRVAAEVERGGLPADPALEDVHMHVEARLEQIEGGAGAHLQTARSRNDQVATDLRLYARDAAARIVERLRGLRRALVDKARTHLDDLMPGYTHLQRAQPVRLAHHLMAYVEMFGRDEARVRDAAARANRSPLGSGALAASSLPIDRASTARALGFDGVTGNSLDAVGDRDFAVELTFCCALAMVHLSRLAEEIVLWSTSEFSFVRVPEAFASGSSLMPQKLNPDAAELVRAKTGRVHGDLVCLLTVLKALPLSYNKDLQETQEPLYDATDTLAACLGVTAGLVAGLRFDVERLREAASDDLLCATELADALVRTGLPFRRAHEQVGAWVRAAQEASVRLRDLDAVPPDLRALLDAERAVEGRDVEGGPARRRVLEAIARAEVELRDAP
jgi:argininosuccinate lyase